MRDLMVRSGDLALLLSADAAPALAALSMRPVNHSREDGGTQVSSALELVAYLDPHIQDILSYLNTDPLIMDLRSSMKNSLHVFE